MIILWLPVAVGVIVGKLLGGKFAKLAALRVRVAWLLVAAVAVQLVLVFMPPVEPGTGPEPLRVVLPLALTAMGVFVLLNIRLPGMWLILAGLLSNVLVIVANGGLMPSNPDALTRAGMTASLERAREHPGIRLYRTKDRMLEWEDTRLPWLSDALVSPPVPKRKIMSVGDLAISLGIGVLTVSAMRGSRQKGVEQQEEGRDVPTTLDGRSKPHTGATNSERALA